MRALIHSLRGFATVSSALAFAALPACSGGGGKSSGPSPITNASSAVAFLTAPHPQLLSLGSTLDSVELLRADGSSSGNLLVAPADVAVISESSDASLAPLRDPAAGSYVACRIHFGSASKAELREGGAVDVEIDGREETLPFATAFEVAPGQHRCLAIAPAGDVECKVDPSGMRHWRPHHVIVAMAGTSLHDARVRVTSVDANAFTFVGACSRPAGFAATFHVGDDIQEVGEDHRNLSRAELFARLQAGVLVKLHGLLGDDGVVEVVRLELRPQRASSDDVEVVAIVTAVDSQSSTAQIDVLAALEGEAAVRSFLAQRSSRSISISLAGVAGIGDLAPGQRVDVELAQFPAAEPMPIESIEVVDRHAELSGWVGDVQGLPSSFVLHPWPHDCLLRAGKVPAWLTVRLSAQTIVWVGRPSNKVGVERIAPEAMLRVTGKLVDEATLEADTIRVWDGERRGG